MYSWNDLKISVEGDNQLFIDGIKKYINAVYVHDYEGICDIKTTICRVSDSCIPPIPATADNTKSLVYNIGSEIRLDVYTFENQYWYIYKNTAEVWFDYSTNELAVAIDSMPIDFEYSNISTFYLDPLGTLLETLGYFRFQCACGIIDGKAVLFAGKHGSGKSTAAFTIPTHGGTIIADDLTFIHKGENGYYPTSLTKLVGLGLETVNTFFPELNRVHSAAFIDNIIYYFLEDINSVKQEEFDISVIAKLEKSGKKATGCTPANPAEIMPILFPEGLHTSIEANTGAKFLFVADMLDEITNCQISSGTDINDLAAHIKALL